MTSFSSLPPDIIHQVVCAFTTSSNCYLRDWKYLLSILALSSTWRSIGKAYVYASAFIVDPQFHENADANNALGGTNKQGTFTAVTNIMLIEQLGLMWSVKRLVIMRTDNFRRMPSTRSIFDLASLADKLNVHSCSSNLPHSIAYARHNTDVASLFLRWLPNVCYLKLGHFDGYAVWKSICITLLYAYLPQLTGLSYCGLSTFPAPIASPTLKELDMVLLADSNGLFPLICAPWLRKLKLSLPRGQYDWNGFQPSADLGMFNFDCLESLSFDTLLTRDRLNVLCQRFKKMRFPKLHSLWINNDNYDYIDIGWLLTRSIKAARLSVSLENAIQICQQGLGSIQKLTIDFSMWGIDYPPEIFVDLTNQLFGLTQGAEEVYLSLTDCDFILKCPRPNWLHLTHLKFYTAHEIDSALAFMLQTPNLVCYDLRISAILNTKDELAHIEQLIHRRAEFSKSKLRVMAIKIDYIQEDHGNLKSSLCKFSRVLPKLQRFDVIF